MRSHYIIYEIRTHCIFIRHPVYSIILYRIIDHWRERYYMLYFVHQQLYTLTYYRAFHGPARGSAPPIHNAWLPSPTLFIPTIMNNARLSSISCRYILYRFIIENTYTTTPVSTEHFHSVLSPRSDGRFGARTDTIIRSESSWKVNNIISIL